MLKMPTPTPAQVRELLALEQQAIGGDWYADGDYLIAPVPNGRPGGENIAMFVSHPRHEKVPSEKTCEFTAALRNLAPGLLESWLRMEAALRALAGEAQEVKDGE